MKNNYKLYRTVYDLIHPSISRKNITDYQILLDEDIIPLKIFYPKYEAELNKAIIYIHGNNINYTIYEELAKRTDNVIFLLEYNQNNTSDDIEKTINYIYKEFDKYSLGNNISVVGDFKGTNIIINSIKNLKVKKKILLEPDNNIEINNLKNTLIITNNIVNNSNEFIYNISTPINSIFNENDIIVKENIYRIINDFLN